jgi:hypothetical protein
VNWKFWQKNTEPEFIIESKDIPTSTLLRWFLYDTAIPNPNKHAKALGFNPISAEGEEMEIRESRARLKKVEPYIDFIALMADINGLVLAETFSELAEKLGLDQSGLDREEEREIMADLYTSIAISCIVPAFSAALEIGILENPGTFVTEGVK